MRGLGRDKWYILIKIKKIKKNTLKPLLSLWFCSISLIPVDPSAWSGSIPNLAAVATVLGTCSLGAGSPFQRNSRTVSSGKGSQPLYIAGAPPLAPVAILFYRCTWCILYGWVFPRIPPTAQSSPHLYCPHFPRGDIDRKTLTQNTHPLLPSFSAVLSLPDMADSCYIYLL